MPTVQLPSEVNSSTDLKQVYEDIKNYCGLDFLPEAFEAWAYDPQELRIRFERMRAMEQTMGKEKVRLMGLAVSAVESCDYCINFHTAILKKEGYRDGDIAEIMQAISVMVFGSAYTTGLQLDPDITPDRVVRKQPKGLPAKISTIALVSEDAATTEVKSVFDDIKAFYGLDFVPNMFRALANDLDELRLKWASIKAMEQALGTEKTHLIGLAVAMAKACDYGINAHTTFLMSRAGYDDAAIQKCVSLIAAMDSSSVFATGLQLKPDLTPDREEEPVPAGSRT